MKSFRVTVIPEMTVVDRFYEVAWFVSGPVTDSCEEDREGDEVPVTLGVEVLRPEYGVEVESILRRSELELCHTGHILSEWSPVRCLLEVWFFPEHLRDECVRRLSVIPFLESLCD